MKKKFIIAIYPIIFFAIYFIVKLSWSFWISVNNVLPYWIISSKAVPQILILLFSITVISLVLFFIEKENILKIVSFRKVNPSIILLAMITGLSLGFIMVCLFNHPFFKGIPSLRLHLEFIYKENTELINR